MVLPRMLSFFLVKLYTNVLPDAADYGDLTIVMAYMVFLNVVLSYGFETGFFRFYNSEPDKQKVVSTTTVSIFISSILFFAIAYIFKTNIANYTNVPENFIEYALWILLFDALVIIPFSKLRAEQKATKFAVIKIGNVAVNLLLNLFFLVLLPHLAAQYPTSIFNSIFIPNFEIAYILIANLIASLITLFILLPDYFKINWKIDIVLWEKLMRYGWPILIAGIAFAVNEHLDKILLSELLPIDIAKSEVGAYSACYKLGLFMVLFRTAYSLGIEPFFFSHAKNENAPQTYATITKYFVIFGSFIALTVIVFADVLKRLLLDNESYWVAMKVVPLIVFANFFLGIYTNLSVWYKLTDKTIYGAYISVVGAIITLLLNFILIKKFSYLGSAIATICAYGAMLILSYFLGRKRYPIPYDTARIFAYLGLSILFSILAFYIDDVRQNFYIKSVLILLFLGVIYVGEKKTLQKILERKTN